VTLLLNTPLMADVRAIQRDKLPTEESVARAYEDVARMELMARDWTNKWPYPTPKKKVAATLEASLKALERAGERAPANEELALLTALAATYAYNVEVEPAAEHVAPALDRARKLSPEDYRPDWFLADFKCHNGFAAGDGMKLFLRLESQMPWDKLPASFWDDYMQCASLNYMPAHTLRAADYRKKLGGVGAEYRDYPLRMAHDKLRTPNPASKYSSRDIWSAETQGSLVIFESPTCAASFASHADWRIDVYDVENSTCAVQIGAGPYPNGIRQVSPNIVLIARPAKPGESLQDFLAAFGKNRTTNPVEPKVCPSEKCLGFEVLEKGMYKEDGDGVFGVTVFERDAPAYPGVLFERPSPAPPPSAPGKVQYYRAPERYSRFADKMYYAVMLDTASSVLEPAKAAYEEFLKSVRVE
jgi:hypothetical protein